MTSEPYDEQLEGDAEGTDDDPGWPVGFIIVLVLAALYLVWRFVQLAVGFVRWLT